MKVNINLNLNKRQITYNQMLESGFLEAAVVTELGWLS